LTVAFRITDDTGQSSDTAYAEIVMETPYPQIASMRFGMAGCLTAQLDGHPWV